MAPLLSLDRVTKRYWRGEDELVVLDNVSLEVYPGEFTVVCGRHVSGKTTLLRVAAGIEPPDSGRISFAGSELTQWTAARRRPGVHPRIGWLRHSGPYLAGMTMLDYVAVPLLGGIEHPEARRAAMHALTRMASGELASATWSELSDTERINVMIARALVHDPVLLIADDPTKGLDERDRDAMLGLVSAIADERGMAVLMSAREVPDGLRAPTTMTLKDGELIAPVGRGARGAVIQFPGGRGGSV